MRSIPRTWEQKGGISPCGGPPTASSSSRAAEGRCLSGALRTTHSMRRCGGERRGAILKKGSSSNNVLVGHDFTQGDHELRAGMRNNLHFRQCVSLLQDCVLFLSVGYYKQRIAIGNRHLTIHYKPPLGNGQYSVNNK